MTWVAVVVFVVSTIFTQCVDGWWDEGHMLVAAVAKLEMAPADVEALEEKLSSWESQYPGMSSLPVAAVWADHVKCAADAPYCRGLKQLDRMELFNSWHYSSIPYNPQNITLPYGAHVIPNVTGAYWALKRLGASLTGNMSELHDHGWFDRPNRHIGTDESSLQHSDEVDFEAKYPMEIQSNGPEVDGERPLYGSEVSWNLQLRLLLHIFGDLHQPLHAAELFSTDCKRGNIGGTITQIPNHSAVKTLHQLWDSAGGALTSNWPTTTEAAILNLAAVYRRRYPKSEFSDRIFSHPFDFEAVAYDTAAVAANVTFPDMLPPRPGSNCTYFEPSGRYMTAAQTTSTKQLVLGGYRLANVLRTIAVVARRTKQTDNRSKIKETEEILSYEGAKENEDANLGENDEAMNEVTREGYVFNSEHSDQSTTVNRFRSDALHKVKSHMSDEDTAAGYSSTQSNPAEGIELNSENEDSDDLPDYLRSQIRLYRKVVTTLAILLAACAVSICLFTCAAVRSFDIRQKANGCADKAQHTYRSLSGEQEL